MVILNTILMLIVNVNADIDGKWVLHPSLPAQIDYSAIEGCFVTRGRAEADVLS